MAIEIKIKGIDDFKKRLVELNIDLQPMIDDEIVQILDTHKQQLKALHLVYCQTGPVDPSFQMIYEDLIDSSPRREEE